MKGFMRQRGKSWELRVFLGHDPLTGKKRYATQTVRGGKREAQRKLAEMVTEAERGLTSRTTATDGGVARDMVRVRRAGLLAEDGEGDAWLHRPVVAADARVEVVGETQAGRTRRVLSPPAGVGWVGRSAPRARNGAPHPRHLATCAQPRCEVGVDWSNPATATTPPRVPASDIKPPARADLARVLRRAGEESPDLACCTCGRVSAPTRYHLPLRLGALPEDCVVEDRGWCHPENSWQYRVM